LVILGGRKPLVVDFTSSIAEEFAVLPSVLITTDCAEAKMEVKIANKTSSFFIIVCVVYYPNILLL